MEVNNIERLLLRYYDGDTTEMEERELKRFFAEEDVPAHLLVEKELFLQIATQPISEVPEGLEDRLSRQIDKWETSEKRELKVKKQLQTIRFRWIGSVAASLLLLFSVGMYLYKPHTTPEPQNICATPEEAYAEAQKALLMFSLAVNKGMEQVETVEEMTGKMQENVTKLLN